MEEGFGSYGGFGFAPVGLVGRDDGEMREAEVGHGPRRRSDIEGIARGDEDDFDAVALGFGEQGMIVAGIAQRAEELPVGSVWCAGKL